jgi:hypothetical protein
VPDDLNNCNISRVRAHPPLSRTGPAPAGNAQPGGSLLALRHLLATQPLRDSNLSDMRRHEGDHAILTAERGPAAAEATMWNVYAFEHWRRNRSAP